MSDAEANKHPKKSFSAGSGKLQSTLPISKVERGRRRKTTPVALAGQKRAVTGPSKPQSAITQRRLRPDAAKRILQRLQQAQAKSKPESQIAPPKPSKAKPVEHTHEVALSDDLSRIWVLLRQKNIDVHDVLEALLAQFEPEQYNKPLVHILLDRQRISQEQYHQLQAVAPLTVKHTGPPLRTLQLDLVLAQQIMEYKLLSRQKVQQLLRIQGTFHKWGIRRTLQDILIEAKILAAEIVTPLIEQIHKEIAGAKTAAETAEIQRAEPIISRKNQNIPFIPVLLAVLLLLFGYFWTIAALAPRRKQSSPAPIPTRTLSTTKKTPLARPGKKIAPSGQTVTKVQSPTRAEKMRKSGLAQWGAYWICKEWKDILLKQWEAGQRPEKLSFELKHRLRYRTDNNGAGLYIRGKLELPPLPAGLYLKMDMKLFDAFQSQNYTQMQFFLNERHQFQAKFALDKLDYGLYFLHLVLEPEHQQDFLQYFFHIDKPRKFILPFTIGSPKAVARYYQNYRRQLETVLIKYRQCYQQLRQLENLPADKINSQWLSFTSKWRRQLKSIARYVNQRQQRREIAVFADINDRLSQLSATLSSIYNNWDNRRRNIADLKQNYQSNCDYFLVQYEQLRIALIAKTDHLRQLLETCKAVRIW